MSFPWSRYPQALQIAIQYIEDHPGHTGTRDDILAMLKLIKNAIGAVPYANLTLTRLENRVSKLVGEHKINRQHKTKDLWVYGARILNLTAARLNIKYNSARKAVDSTKGAPSRKGPLSKRTSAEVEEMEQTPSKRSKKSPALESRKRSSEEVEEVEEIPSKRSKKSPVSQSHGESLATIAKSLATIAEPGNVEIAQSIKSASGNDKKQATPNLDASAFSSGNTTSPPVKEAAFAKSDRPNNSKTKPPPKQAKALFPSSNPKLGTKSSSREDSGEPLDYAILDYSPRKPPEQAEPHSAQSIRDTMKEIADEIIQAVHTEFDDRKLNKETPFLFDETRFDTEATLVVNKIFGSGWWNIGQLKAKINETQLTRRLELLTFVVAFVGASVTMRALEPPPQGAINQQSTEFNLLKHVLWLVGEEEMKKSHNKLGARQRQEVAYRHAIRNYIHQQKIPNIAQEADLLAQELRSQIHALFPAAFSYWRCNPTQLLPSGPLSAARSGVPDRDLYPVTQSSCPGPEKDEFWKSLKRIFTMALTSK